MNWLLGSCDWVSEAYEGDRLLVDEEVGEVHVGSVGVCVCGAVGVGLEHVEVVGQAVVGVASEVAEGGLHVGVVERHGFVGEAVGRRVVPVDGERPVLLFADGLELFFLAVVRGGPGQSGVLRFVRAFLEVLLGVFAVLRCLVLEPTCACVKSGYTCSSR